MSRNASVATTRFLYRGLVLPLFAMLLAGCGVPGEPLPPLLEIPAPVKDLSVAQEGAHLLLHWSPPVMTTEDTRTRELARIDLYGAFLADSAPLTNFAAQSRIVKNFQNSNGASLLALSGDQFPLSANQIGQKASFALKAINRKGKDAGFSNVASLEILDVPAPPANIQTTVTEKTIRLNWKAATLSAFGGPPPPATGYRIFRSDSLSEGPAEQIGESEGESYDDVTFEFGHTYRYFVRAFVREGESVALTPQSPTVEIAALDTFPPAAPRNLRAIAVPGAVELAWSPNSESDLAGYNVYRKSGELFTRLNTELLHIPTFRDSQVAAGERVVYVVKAVDKSGNESAPSQEAIVTAE